MESLLAFVAAVEVDYFLSSSSLGLWKQTLSNVVVKNTKHSYYIC